MLVRDAIAAARDWVHRDAARLPGFAGAFLAGSTAHRDGRDELPPWSDVDVRVVIRGPLPPKPGKLRHGGVLLDVDVVAAAELADADQVAGSFHLAPCFAADGVLADPTGLLRRLRAAVAPAFARPAQVRRRCADVADRIGRRLAALDPAQPWPQQVLAWLFPATLLTNVVLVAALRNPTVRLRFPAARAVLQAEGHPDLAERFFALLGCAAVDRAVVARHLDRLEDVFDRAAALGDSSFAFSSDITPLARPIAIDGSRWLVESGDHRDAVFWIVATHARCRQILDLRAPDPAGAEFGAVVADLLGLDGPAALRERADAVPAALPHVWAVAAAIGGFGVEPNGMSRYSSP
jgi:hypothetical protein